MQVYYRSSIMRVSMGDNVEEIIPEINDVRTQAREVFLGFGWSGPIPVGRASNTMPMCIVFAQPGFSLSTYIYINFLQLIRRH